MSSSTSDKPAILVVCGDQQFVVDHDKQDIFFILLEVDSVLSERGTAIAQTFVNQLHMHREVAHQFLQTRLDAM